MLRLSPFGFGVKAVSAVNIKKKYLRQVCFVACQYIYIHISKSNNKRTKRRMAPLLLLGSVISWHATYKWDYQLPCHVGDD